MRHSRQKNFTSRASWAPWKALGYVFPTLTFIGAVGLRFLEGAFFKGGTPEVVLGVLFFWALYRPQLISFSFLIVLGFWLDVMETSPLGWTSFTWTFFGFLVWSQRRLLIKAPFGMVWGAFSFFSTGLIIINGMVFSLVNSCPIGVERLWGSSLMTIATYPLIFYLLVCVDRRIIKGLNRSGSSPRGVVDPDQGVGGG